MFSKYIKNIECKNFTRGAHPAHEGGGAPYPPGRAPIPHGNPWWPSGDHLPLYGLFQWEKIISHLLGRNSAAMRQNLGGTNLGLWRSCSAVETPTPEGEIITIIITNAPLIRRGQSPSTSSSAPSHLKTLVHLLYPILVSKSGIGASRLLVVLITPCS